MPPSHGRSCCADRPTRGRAPWLTKSQEDDFVSRRFSVRELILARAPVPLVLRRAFLDLERWRLRKLDRRLCRQQMQQDRRDADDDDKKEPPMLALGRIVREEWDKKCDVEGGIGCCCGQEQPPRRGEEEEEGWDKEQVETRRYLRRLTEQTLRQHETWHQSRQHRRSEDQARREDKDDDASSMEDDDGIDELYGVWAAMLTSTAAVVVANADTASNKEGEEENDDGDNPLHETRTLSPSPPSSQLLSASSSSSSSTTLEFRIGRFHGCCCDCDGQRQEGLRIRVFPFHNDLSLRLWEGGAVLSEFLLANPCLVQNRRVVELGSGTGLASLVSLLACGADRVVATDKSDRAVENLRHNFELNRSLVHSVASSPSSTWECRRYDWNDALDPREVDEDNNDDNDYGDVLISSQVLMAADVAYDDDMIPGLVEAIRRFFFEKEKGAATTATTTTTTEPLSNNGSGDNNKLAILATTRRNPATFTRLLQGLCRVLQLAEMDDAPLNDNDDYDVIGNDANNGNSASNEKSSLDFLELVLAVAGAGSEDGGNRKGILDGDVNALVGESCGGGECRAPPPPIAFPARFVQPRSDVSIFMIRPRQPTRSRGYCLNASTRMDDEGYLLLHNRPSHQRSGGGEEGDFSLRAS